MNITFIYLLYCKHLGFSSEYLSSCHATIEGAREAAKKALVECGHETFISEKSQDYWVFYEPGIYGQYMEVWITTQVLES